MTLASDEKGELSIVFFSPVGLRTYQHHCISLHATNSKWYRITRGNLLQCQVTSGVSCVSTVGYVDWIWFTPWCNTQILPRLSLLSKWNTVLRYTRENDVIYSRKKRTAFPEPIFTKLKVTRQYYMQICYTEFHPNWILSVKTTDRDPLTPLS